MVLQLETIQVEMGTLDTCSMTKNERMLFWSFSELHLMWYVPLGPMNLIGLRVI